jgi:tripartite-type tricarboxylate transporter receptor subunit TctC
VKLARRKFLRLAATAAALPTALRFAWAETYPTQPVHIIVGFAAGSTPDITARLIAQSLSNRFRQQFIIDNRPGAGTNIATEVVVRAPADGYTLLWVTAPNAINATLYDKLNFNFIRDIAPVSSVVRLPNVIVVNPSVPAKTVPEFIAYAKANPGKINMASSTIGGTDHLSGELFKVMAGIDMVNVPYRGGGAALFTDLLSGQVQVNFSALPAAIGYIRADKLRALAVTTTTRSDAMPDIPTVSDFLPGYEASTWHGVGLPKATPAEIIDKLNNQINATLADPVMKARLAELGGTVLPGSRADFGKLISDETEKWGKVVRFAGITT